MKKRQLRPIWQVLIEATEIIGTLAVIYALTVIFCLIA